MNKTWGKRATVVTALPVNDLGWLVEDFICQGGVDTSLLSIWREFDGLGRNTRVGLNLHREKVSASALPWVAPTAATAPPRRSSPAK